jgi:hypothetical protein
LKNLVRGGGVFFRSRKREDLKAIPDWDDSVPGAADEELAVVMAVVDVSRARGRTVRGWRRFASLRGYGTPAWMFAGPEPPQLAVLGDVAGGACVTGSVTVGSERDGQDITGRDPIIEPYLP